MPALSNAERLLIGEGPGNVRSLREAGLYTLRHIGAEECASR